MHLKNWSLLENGPLIELAPAYDYLNTSILIANEEESALELAGQKSGFDSALLVDRLGRDLCEISPRRIRRTLEKIHSIHWLETIAASRLSPDLKSHYATVVSDRLGRLSA